PAASPRQTSKKKYPLQPVAEDSRYSCLRQHANQVAERAVAANQQSSAHWNSVNIILQRINDLTSTEEKDETELDEEEQLKASHDATSVFNILGKVL
ncbi:MAG: hypothetical protein SGPRY_005495, partial [Prymnesium sp.]